MKLTKFTKILFATIAFSVLVHFVLRKNVREGYETAENTEGENTSNEETETTGAEESPETNEVTASPTTTAESEECKAAGEAGNFDDDCNAKSYVNDDFSSKCAVYGGKTTGDVECRTSCCGNKSSSKLQENLDYSEFKKQVDQCQDAENENSRVCRAIDSLAESRATNMVLREKEEAAEDYQGYETNPNNAQTSTVNTNTQCKPDRASAYTRECNVTTGFFTDRPSGWPFPKNSNNYENHLTGCNCPPCKKYENPRQVL